MASHADRAVRIRCAGVARSLAWSHLDRRTTATPTIRFGLHRGLGQRGWSICGVASAVVGIILVAAGPATENFLGPTFGGLVIYSFLSAVSGRLLALAPTASAQPDDLRMDRVDLRG